MYTIGPEWLGDFTRITPCGMDWLAQRLRNMGYDARVSYPYVEVDREVEWRHWERLVEAVPREYAPYSYDPAGWLEEQIQPPRRPRRRRRRAIRHALRLVRAISDCRGRIMWWELSNSRPKIERVLRRIARIDRGVAETVADMLSVHTAEPLEL